MPRRSTPGDGRRMRPSATREAVLTAVRRLMAAGNFRPTADDVVAADGFSERSIRNLFGSLENAHLAAIDDDATSHGIAAAALAQPDERSLARVIVLGRLST